MTPSITPVRSEQRFPAPVAFLAGWVLCLLLQRGAPLPALPRAWGWGLFVGLNLAGIALGLATVAAMRRVGVSANPDRPAATLVTDGPFGWSRNPMYLSMALNYLGLGAPFATSWSLALILPLVALVHVGVVKAEEHALSATFGDEWTAYAGRVRPWL